MSTSVMLLLAFFVQGLAGLISTFKLHMLDWLVTDAWLALGRHDLRHATRVLLSLPFVYSGIDKGSRGGAAQSRCWSSSAAGCPYCWGLKRGSVRLYCWCS
jgi:hypothetical protein